jgi:frataxin-like iron-binding protein CyaY
MRANVVTIVIIALMGGFFWYRQSSLERRIDELTEQLGAANAVAGEESAVPDAVPKAGEPAAAIGSHATRLSALEAGLKAIHADLRSLEKATGDGTKMVTDQQILSVMKEQGSKVMENQLKFHRERWLEQRETALNDFSRRYGLNQTQNDQLWDLLSSETDKMVEILRNPELAEDPERAARVWKESLLDTDAEAHRVLDPQKAVLWDQARFAERKLLWPWLPD